MNRRVLRRGISNVMVGLMVGGRHRGACCRCFFILVNLIVKGAGSLSLGVLHQDAGARRRDRRRGAYTPSSAR